MKTSNFIFTLELFILLGILFSTWQFDRAGGSLIFISLIGINFYFSRIYKTFLLETTLISIILILLIGLNILAATEISKGLSIWLLLTYLLLSSLIIFCIIRLAKRAFGPREPLTALPEKVELRKRMAGLLASPLNTLFFIMASAAFLADDRAARIASEYSIYLSSLVLGWLVIGMLYAIYLIRKPQKNKYLPYLTIKSDIKIETVKKSFPYTAVFILLVGFGLESGRRLWFIWLLSWVLFILIVLFEWQTWKYVFQKSTPDISMINREEVNLLPTMTNPTYFLKFLAVSWLIGMLYVILALIFFYKTGLWHFGAP